MTLNNRTLNPLDQNFATSLMIVVEVCQQKTQGFRIQTSNKCFAKENIFRWGFNYQKYHKDWFIYGGKKWTKPLKMSTAKAMCFKSLGVFRKKCLYNNSGPFFRSFPKSEVSRLGHTEFCQVVDPLGWNVVLFVWIIILFRTQNRCKKSNNVNLSTEPPRTSIPN